MPASSSRGRHMTAPMPPARPVTIMTSPAIPTDASVYSAAPGMTQVEGAVVSKRRPSRSGSRFVIVSANGSR